VRACEWVLSVVVLLQLAGRREGIIYRPVPASDTSARCSLADRTSVMCWAWLINAGLAG